jgi:tripartite motif-containing protein 71
MNFQRLSLAALFFAIFFHPSDLWAKKHRIHAPTATPTTTPTQTPTATATPVPYNGPKLYTFDTMWGSKGTNNDQLNDPESIDISPSGKMVIADTGNSRIVVWDSNGKPVTTFGSFGTRADWRNPPQFNHPTAVFIHPSKKIYVADTLNQRVVVLDEHGLVLSSWGAQGSDIGNFNLPRSIAKDHFGNIWVLDSGNSRIEIFSELGQFTSTWGAFGDPTSTTITAMMSVPLGMTVNNIDQGLVADTGNFRFQVFNDGGVPVTYEGWFGDGPDQFKEPGGVAITKDGVIAITDGMTGRVEFFNHRFDFIGQWTAKDDILNANYHPHFRGITADSQGRLYLTDIQNDVIVRIKPVKGPEVINTPTRLPPTPTPPETDPYGGQGFPIR